MGFISPGVQRVLLRIEPDQYLMQEPLFHFRGRVKIYEIMAIYYELYGNKQ